MTGERKLSIYWVRGMLQFVERSIVIQFTERRVIELTGDVTPDLKSLKAASVIITTPEKWDGISRQWQTRVYVQNVRCVIIDEIHLLGERFVHVYFGD